MQISAELTTRLRDLRTAVEGTVDVVDSLPGAGHELVRI